MVIEDYEILVLGSGEAGKYLGWTMAKAGRKTAVIERKMIGGSCPNIACLPSKNIIHSAKVASDFQRGEEFGMMTESWHVDMERVRQRKRKMVDELVQMHLGRFKDSGAELILGNGVFIGPKTMEVTLRDVGTRTLRGEKVFLNTGTRAAMPEIPGLAESKPMTHIEALELAVVPEHLVILGAGYVGLELAQAIRRFGSRVTLLERGPRLAEREDEDISSALLELMRDDGIEVLLNAKLMQVKGISGDAVQLQVGIAGAERSIAASHILVATGRVPNTQNIGLENTGIETDERGYFRVNESLKTTAPDVWAMGDCAGSPHFTHVAFDDFRVVRDNLLGVARTTRDRVVPYCVFTDPELARVGLNEQEAQARGISYRVARLPMAAVLRTRTLSEERGFMKALVGDDDRILGFMAFGVSAGEIMAMVQIAMAGNLPYTSLRDMVLTHPTLAEGLVFLFMHLPAKA